MAALRRCLQSTRQPFTTRHALSTRSFTSTSIRPNDKQNMMDKDSINTDSREYSKTGGDDSTAATEDAAFNPNKTSPEEEHATASRESGGESNNPLNVSPANKEISDPNNQQKGGATGSPSETGQGGGRERSSGGGSPKKSGGGKSGGGPL
ncbi:hypothetical protein CLAFUW4_02279 [Fulvia fulva]|uniref:Uncharacterized protein n=1 Tax=Passalora fulva TaxID=5499 RepID=A0A9Q8L7G2_PASFU|nr:uncharacterized protein CLAFUR5_02269 [Fulvia fulva]KAK4635354.1 hypothetical protein CLAFUR4_02274 [Fulvia fulva]KAK4637771.1 hypothetical protein CLAFUR0_02278 [Fulvia fulva]UJO12214.1 hypothetical protein CLAFUR5_02269 [Fulvia fulva]WPV09279.1 hypothetical protein CLAFUW4_02279 [Fulvia fulva]WPV23109.1 hypothetical protein CLAFUW7_02279 [Fulvia fulva]